MSTILGSIIFGALGFFLAGYLIVIFIRACFPVFSNRQFSFNPQLVREQWQLSKRVKLLKQIDGLLLSENHDAALRALGSCFYLGHPSSAKKTIERVKAHNLGSLNRLVSISQKKDLKLEMLSDLEDLFAERSRLIDLFFDSVLLRDKIRDKYRREGKNQGTWNKAEYEKQIQELRADIERNRVELIKDLEVAFQLVLKSEKRGDVIYH